MKFHKASIEDVHLIELERLGDDRGFFARYFCESEFREHGLETRFVQINNSLSAKKGTLRGIHYQLPPAAEVKVVRCVRGALWDVVVDLRPDSPTFKKWYGAELTAENRLMMYVPRGFAHALITLAEDTEAIYLVSNSYSPDLERGIRWNDPAIRIEWPLQPSEISSKDQSWPDFDEAFHQVGKLKSLK